MIAVNIIRYEKFQSQVNQRTGRSDFDIFGSARSLSSLEFAIQVADVTESNDDDQEHGDER